MKTFEENISDQLESIKNEMCDNYCKYSAMRADELDEVELADICAECPLNRL